MLCKLILATFTLLLLASPRSSFADWNLMPESHHQLYDQWGTFLDDQSSLVNYGQARVWTGIGGTVPLIGDQDSVHHPAFFIHASANAALHYNDNWRIWTETLDVRLGFGFEWELDSHLRFSIGYTHFSAHSADGLSSGDSDLIEPSVGQEFIPMRAVYDLDKMFRFSVTLKPFTRSWPSVKPLWADQSIEFYPWGAQDSPTRPSPYVTFGLEESGISSYVWTYHTQVGVYWGNHFSGGHRQTVRVVAGYYNGADPRLKYFELREAKMAFGYFGVMFDI